MVNQNSCEGELQQFLLGNFFGMLHPFTSRFLPGNADKFMFDHFRIFFSLKIF